MHELLNEISHCRRCAHEFDHEPRPVIQASERARVLIIGQAPGRKVHETGVPFNDASGNTLRKWLGLSNRTFYDPACVAIVPMALCYPGKGKSGDLPPPPRCSATWHERVFNHLREVELTLLIGRYAQEAYLDAPQGTVTDNVANWHHEWPHRLPLPHPSPRNRFWLQRNPWFEQQVVPALRGRVFQLLGSA